MVSNTTFRQIALSFDNAVEVPHFESSSFRVNNKIFAALNEARNRISLKLSPEVQAEFCELDEAIHPVDDKWGQKGWTFIDLEYIREDMLSKALAAAYKEVTTPKRKAKKT